MGQYTAAVQGLYVAYFNRPADPVGLQYWEGIVASKNGDTSGVSAFFGASDEYKATYAGMSTSEIVNRVYQNLFGRDAEPAGLLYWAQKLTAGDLRIDNVVAEVSRNAVGTDADAVAAKTAAAITFTNALDTTAEILAYNGKDALAIGRTYLSGVTDADTQAAAEAGIDTTITSVINAADAVNNKGQTYTLTAGIDTFTGGKGNDSFIANATAATGQTLSSFDSIDGGAGTDTLTLVSATGSALTIPSTATVKNIESATITGDSSITGDLSTWTGLTAATVASTGDLDLTLASTTAGVMSVATQAANDLTVNGGSSISLTTTGQTSGSISVGTTTAATGAVTVAAASSAAGARGAISVHGGSTISVTQTASNAVNTTSTNASVNVTGGSSTTAVTVAAPSKATASSTVAGITANSVAVTDINAGSDTKAGTITSLTVSNATTVGFAGTALTSLSLTGTSGNIIIDNSGLTTPTNKTLTATVNGVTGGVLDDADIYTKLNINATGANSTLANITFGAVTDLTVAGTKVLTLTSTAGLSALKNVTVSGSAGITADLSAASVKAVDTSASTGTSTVTVDASVATFTGGAGVDKVTTAATTVGKAISLGAGDDSLVLGGGSAPTAKIDGGAGSDSLTMTAALAATSSASSTFAGLVTNFEKLTLTGATNQTIDLAVLGNFADVTTSAGNGLTLSNLPSGGSLTLNGAGTAYTIGNTAFAAGTNDTVNLKLTDGTGAAIAFASTGITATGVENFVISTADTQATPSGTFLDSVTLLGNSVKAITVSGNAGLTLTSTSTALTSVDASGISLGGFTWTSGALAAAATVKGSATGTNTIDASAATAAVTYTGGSGADAVTITTAKNNVLTLGDGNNTAALGAGNNTVTAGKGADTVTVGNGNNTVSLGDGANSFTAGSGNNTYTGGSGVDTVTVGGGVNNLTLGTGADVVTLTSAGANVNTYTTIVDPHSGVQIALGNIGTEIFGSTKVTLAATAVFQDYANAVVQAGGNASTNAYFGWFQFNGDTYLVESVHDGASTPSFVNGSDVIIKLTGLVDLSAATQAGHIFTLA